MEYWKVKKCIREVLEQNKEKISDRAEARVLKMSQKGYTSMMGKHTMTVKKLEEIASIFNKSVSYFYVTTENEENQIYTEAAKTTNMDVAEEAYGCKLCAAKDEHIADLRKTIGILEKQLPELEPKKEITSATGT